MELREETLSILRKAFEPEDAYKIVEYFESRIRDDVATQKDIYELKLEIEKVRAEIEKVRAEVEKVRADLSKDIERVRADLSKDIERVRADLLKWSFAFWISQVVLLGGILFKLLS